MTLCWAVDRMAVRAFGSLRSSVHVPDMWNQRDGSTLKGWLWPALSESHVAWQHQKQKPGVAETEWMALPSRSLQFSQLSFRRGPEEKLDSWGK